MWETALLLTMLQTFSMETNSVSCQFPPTDDGREGISLTLQDRPSLKDQPGLYRVELQMNGSEALLATAQPITSTGERDALILARPTKQTVLSVGFRDDGTAALWVSGSKEEEDAPTRIGMCHGHERVLQRWLSS